MFPGCESALLAVQVFVGADGVTHPNSSLVMTKSSHTRIILSQQILTKSSKLTIPAMVGP